MAAYNGSDALGNSISGVRAPWVDNPDTKLQDMIDDVLRASTTRIGAPNPTQAGLMTSALTAQLGVSGKSPQLAVEQAKVAGDQYKQNTEIVQGQKPNVTGIGVGAIPERNPIVGLTPTGGTPSASKMTISHLTGKPIKEEIDRIFGGQ